MRRFRKSLSLRVAFLALCVSAPIRGADVVATLLEHLGPDDEYLLVWVVSSSREQTLWLEDLAADPTWSAAVGSHPTATLHAEKNRSFLIQFAIESTPVCLVLDSSGREVGRLRIAELTKDAVRSLPGRLSDLLTAAEASRRYENGSDVRDGDASTLFWLGSFHWNRGERYKALRWFEEYTALPRGRNGADPELQARALYRLGEHALETGQIPRAEEHFSRALDLSRAPEQKARCALALARSLRRLGHADRAIQSIESQLRSQGASPLRDRLLFTLGYLHLDLGHREKAREVFTECMTSYPTSAYSRKSAHYLSELGESPEERTEDA
jgi:tetratricopeptide (TPR) repeat protein